jgi:hypothetical protein
MRRHLLTTLVLGQALFAAGCTETRQPLATAPNTSLTAGPVPSANDIRAQIVALFPPPGLRTAALSQFDIIARLITAGRTADAQGKMQDLVAFTVQKLGARKLLDPNGSAPPSTQGAVLDLINALYAFVGLESPVPPEAQGSDGATAVIGSGGGDLLPEHRLAGLRVPAGAVSGDHLFVIARRDDLAEQGTCLSTSLTQYPLCYDYAVFPATTFRTSVTVVVCQLEPPPVEPIRSRLVLAHPSPDGQVQFTTRVSDPFHLDCTDALLPEGGIGGLLRRLGEFAARLIGPPKLYASHAGLGGLTGSFSPFIAVDTLSAVGLCPGGIVGRLVTFANFPDAVATVSSGGKIEVCSGTFTVSNVQVTKPVTIEAAPDAGTRPVIRYDAGTADFPTANGFLIDAVASGTVAFRRLTFVSTGTRPFMISAQGTYDQVVVDSSDFTITGSSAGTGVFGGSSTVEGARVVVNHSSFSGGESGVFASGDDDEGGNPILSTAPHFDVLNSTFHDFTFSGIQHQEGSSGLISSNTVSACGFNGCIRTVRDGPVVVRGNSVTVEGDRLAEGQRIRWGIAASAAGGGSHVIAGNTVTGVGAGPTGHAIARAGIGIGRVVTALPPEAVDNATVSGNTIVNADTGISAGDAVITGTDNVVTGTLMGISAVSVLATTSVTLNRSDVTSYVVPMGGAGLFDLTCNWWGSAAGPENVSEDVPAAVFTPFATVPIANNPGVTCGSGASGAPVNGSFTAPMSAPSGAPPRLKAGVVRTRKRPSPL